MLRCLLIAFALLAACGCARGPRMLRVEGASMGTTWSVTVPPSRATDADALRASVQRRLDGIVAVMSHWDSGSELSRFNRAQSGVRLALSPDLFEVLRHASALAADTGGAYDPSVGALVNLWGFGPRGGRAHAPPPAEIAAALGHTGWTRLQLDPGTRSALQPGGVELDLSSIAPGFAVDRIADLLLDAGIENFLIELGGELRAHGRRPGGTDWQVAIESPPTVGGEPVGDESPPAAVLALRNRAMGASGDYRHVFEDAGHRYLHTLDARDGYPVRHRLAAVTVVADDCMHADAWASALMVLGDEAGPRFAQARGIAAVFLVRDGPRWTRHETAAFRALGVLR